MVALQCVKLEEGLDDVFDIGIENWLPLGRCKDARDIHIGRRIQEVFVSVNMVERHIAVNYLLQSGEGIDRYVKF